ncbi:MAG: efflux RND transporter periplasmic adaptor subunit [Phycisphaerales bacterium]|nr:efflux RND transporter periplasmic adaptor subunit [Phycisphaerales bacterium]
MHCKSRRQASLRSAAVLLAVLSLAGGCKKEDKANAYVAPEPPGVIVANPVERDVVKYLTYTGTIEASETVEVRARVQGFLESVDFKAGQKVKKGDLLFTIDPRQYVAAVDQAKAALEAAEATFLGAQNDAKLARELADQRAGPEIDAVIKAARRDVAKAEIARAKANLAQAQLNLDYCTIRAPIDGHITTNYVDVGNLVGRSEPTLLATIVATAPAYVSIDANEADVLEVKRDSERAGNTDKGERGQLTPGNWRPCELALADETDFKVKGRVDYVDPQLNAQTGTLRVRTQYENANDTLVPGLFARVRFPMSTRKSLVVPDAALLSDQQGRYAMVVNDKNEVEARRIKIGTLDGSMRVVEEGLKPEDRVIVLGVLKARPGSKVTPKAQEPAPAGR